MYVAVQKKIKSKELKKQLFNVSKPINDRYLCHLFSFTPIFIEIMHYIHSPVFLFATLCIPVIKEN